MKRNMRKLEAVLYINDANNSNNNSNENGTKKTQQIVQPLANHSIAVRTFVTQNNLKFKVHKSYADKHQFVFVSQKLASQRKRQKTSKQRKSKNLCLEGRGRKNRRPEGEERRREGRLGGGEEEEEERGVRARDKLKRK